MCRLWFVNILILRKTTLFGSPFSKEAANPLFLASRKHAPFPSKLSKVNSWNTLTNMIQLISNLQICPSRTWLLTNSNNFTDVWEVHGRTRTSAMNVWYTYMLKIGKGRNVRRYHEFQFGDRYNYRFPSLEHLRILKRVSCQECLVIWYCRTKNEISWYNTFDAPFVLYSNVTSPSDKAILQAVVGKIESRHPTHTEITTINLEVM